MSNNRKLSVKLMYVKGNHIHTRTMGKIAEDIRKMFCDTFGKNTGLQLCDDLGSILIPHDEDYEKEGKKK